MTYVSANESSDSVYLFVTFSLSVPETSGNPENTDCIYILLIYFSASFLMPVDNINTVR